MKGTQFPVKDMSKLDDVSILGKSKVQSSKKNRQKSPLKNTQSIRNV